MEKYELLPQQLLHEGTVEAGQFFVPAPAEEALILETHEPDYWRRLSRLELTRQEIRRTGFPLSERLVLRERIIAQGTIDCTAHARAHGVALNIAGGTHHAFTDHGEGFCLLNDIAMAARYLLNHEGFRRILVVDLDVHQGNGTAQIFRDEPRVFTFSMHGERNYPLEKERSDLDVGLPDGTGDQAYLGLLGRHLPDLLQRVEPEFVFFQSGVDVLATDKLGKLGLTLAGCKQRDRMVLEACRQAGVPVVASMGGGYSARIADIVEAHANTYRLAQELFG
jgi:acetoin utilization deacetylase AcuC-like enzyme